MLIFRVFFKTQSDQNIHQNAQTAPDYQKFSRKLAYRPIPLNLLAYTFNFS